MKGMCGIVGGITQKKDIVPILLEGLKRLEYRGYDSAGIALIDGHQFKLSRVKGKVQDLVDLLAHEPLSGSIGIAHTRWATHGEPSEINAHPHVCGPIAIVHNGIIENHELLREKLAHTGYEFSSQTDTEIAAHLIRYYCEQGKDLLTAVRFAVNDLEGAFALGVIHVNEPTRLIAVRFGSPLLIALGDFENFIASDSLALSAITKRFIYLEEGDIADVTLENVVIYDKTDKHAERAVHILPASYDRVERGKYRHFMQKEIFEQSQAVAATLEGRIVKTHVLEQAFGPSASALFDRVKRIRIIACGTSYHAGLIARYWLEGLAGIPCQVEVASEYRYRATAIEPDTLFIVISQSGETADTLAALRLAKQQNYLGVLAICNVAESSIVRESDLVLMTRAGVEIGVASTKAFTTQLAALLMLAIVAGRRHSIDETREMALVTDLQSLPRKIEETLKIDQQIQALAHEFINKQHALFLGRGNHYPVALEGALKLKEISYIHAEGYPSGELKHGPLALVDKDMPVVAVAPNDGVLEKLKSNLQEVRARGGKLIVYADVEAKLKNGSDTQIIEMPAASPIIAPIIYTIPLQLLAYHVAVLKGTDIDQPRNLAKSVTVE
jgi:glucosamine--fructose-6-phosphate aminotransferase (isomerizing)